MLISFSSRRFLFVFHQPDGCLLEAVALAFELEEMASVQEAVKNSRGCGIVSEELSPIIQGAILGYQAALSGRVSI